jgi:hypothetical protein
VQDSNAAFLRETDGNWTEYSDTLFSYVTVPFPEDWVNVSLLFFDEV